MVTLIGPPKDPVGGATVYPTFVDEDKAIRMFDTNLIPVKCMG
jgi:hypothetical protein